MLRAREILLTLLLIYGIHGKPDAKEKEDDAREETYHRHVIEEGVKAAIFGSNSYDPINQVFETLQRSNSTNAEVASNKSELQDRKFFEDQSHKESAKSSQQPTPFTTGKALKSVGDSWWSGYKFRAGDNSTM